VAFWPDGSVLVGGGVSPVDEISQNGGAAAALTFIRI
jgi:hypothetical protein